MQYRITGLAADVSAQSLTLDAVDAAAARAAAVARGITVVDVRPLKRRRWTAPALRSGFDLDLFCQELLALLDGGISVGEALQTLAEKARDRGPDGPGRALIAELHAALQEGRTLSDAMARRPEAFPDVLVAAIRASERTSDYGPALLRFHRYRTLVGDVRSRLVAAATYPVILLAASLLVLVFLVGFVVPRFAQVYADLGDRVPLGSRLIIGLGQIVSTQPLLSAAVAALAVLGLVAVVRAPRLRAQALGLARLWPRVDQLLFAASCARLYRTLALLVQGGVALPSALAMVQPMLQAPLADRLLACRQAISEGRGFTDSMAAHGLSTAVATRFFRVGERSGKLGEMIERAADFHERELVRAADWFGRVVGPALMLLMGIVIGVVVIMMYLPIFQLSEALQ